MTQTADDKRCIRYGILKETDCLVMRHREQKELVAAGLLAETSITEAQYLELLQYRQDLRGITETDLSPDDLAIPAACGSVREIGEAVP